jgi:hypothetical protein
MHESLEKGHINFLQFLSSTVPGNRTRGSSVGRQKTRRPLGPKTRDLKIPLRECARPPLCSGHHAGPMRQNAALVAFALAVFVVQSRCEEGAGSTTDSVAGSKPTGIAGYSPVCRPLQLHFVGG